MKVGDYVRTKKGTIYQFNSTSSKALSGAKKYMVKSSPNIIDLIEEGDYVNGNVVKELNNELVIITTGLIYDDNLYVPIKKIDIKSVVTCEQFSQMEYKIGE